MLTFTAITLLHAVSESFASDHQPNIVIILADDLGWNAVGYHNSRMETPNIDRIVSEGMELDRFYVAPMCSPTRAGLLTGRYPIRYGCARAVIPPQRDFGLPLKEITLAETLKDHGYQNRGIFGKWHLGHRRTKWHPLKRGFTEFVGHYNGAIDYFELTRENERDWHSQFAPSDQQGYATDLIAEAASSFIEKASRSDSPYFCYVPFNAPHSPFQAPESAVARFDSFQQIREIGGNDRNRRINRLQTYSAMIWKMDQGIGRILDTIEKSGEADQTIVWFLSDNGGVGGIWENNTPLRGSKLTVYEGGIRVPAAIRWPEQIKPGSKLLDAIGYIDLYPTLVAAAKGPQDGISRPEIDGINLLSILKNQTDQPLQERIRTQSQVDQRPWYSYHGQQGEESEHLAVTQHGWKLKVNGQRLRNVEDLQKPNVAFELFHLAHDPFEQANVADDNPEKVARLAELLTAYRDLQPKNSVPRYNLGSKGFIPPTNWQATPDSPNQLLGHYPEPQ